MKQLPLSNQELLLNSNSRFFKKDFAEKEPTKASNNCSKTEQIMSLCWNGLLPYLLPEVIETGLDNKPLSIWEINATRHLVDIRMGEVNANLNTIFSINPYVYLSLMEYN